MEELSAEVEDPIEDLWRTSSYVEPHWIFQLKLLYIHISLKEQSAICSSAKHCHWHESLKPRPDLMATPLSIVQLSTEQQNVGPHVIPKMCFYRLGFCIGSSTQNHA